MHALRAALALLITILATLALTPTMGTAGTATIAPASHVPAPVVMVAEDPCHAVAREVYVTQEYTGTDAVVECLGAEDSARTELALETGTTIDQWYQDEAGHWHRLYPV